MPALPGLVVSHRGLRLSALAGLAASQRGVRSSALADLAAPPWGLRSLATANLAASLSRQLPAPPEGQGGCGAPTGPRGGYRLAPAVTPGKYLAQWRKMLGVRRRRFGPCASGRAQDPEGTAPAWTRRAGHKGKKKRGDGWPSASRTRFFRSWPGARTVCFLAGCHRGTNQSILPSPSRLLSHFSP